MGAMESEGSLDLEALMSARFMRDVGSSLAMESHYELDKHLIR